MTKPIETIINENKNLLEFDSTGTLSKESEVGEYIKLSLNPINPLKANKDTLIHISYNPANGRYSFEMYHEK